MSEMPEATRKYNKRHGVEVKFAIDVLRRYVSGLDKINPDKPRLCDYCIMRDVCFNLFGKCCPLVFEYHRDATTDEISCSLSE